MAENLPNRVRALREARKLRLKDLGLRIGCGTTHVSDLETGKRELSYPWMQRIARALGVRPGDLLLPEDQHDPLAEEELVLLDCFRAASAGQRAQVLRMVDVLVPECDLARRTG